jgi:ribose transport system permease protein
MMSDNNPVSEVKIKFANFNFNKIGFQVMFLVMLIIFAILSSNFLTLDNFRNVLRQSSILFFITAGQTIVMLTGGIDLSQGSIVSLVSIITAVALCSCGLVPGVLIGLLVGLLCGAVTGLFVGKGRLQPFIASLGMMYLADGFALIATNGQPVSNLPAEFVDKFFWLGGGYIGWLPVPVIFAIIAFVVLHVFLKHTRTGRYIYAVGGNEECSRLSGVNIARIKFLIFLLSGLLCAVGSIILTARIVSGQPLLGGDYVMQSLGATVIGGTSLTGGVGGVVNAVFGVLFIGFMTNGLNLLGVPTFVQRVVIGAVIILSVYMATINKKKN